jgi:hypothetical protein
VQQVYRPYDDKAEGKKQMANSRTASDPHPRLRTIGHSNHELDRFLALLHGAGVTAVADVRSQPFSKRHPQFNGPELGDALDHCGIGYIFLGNALGGRPQSAGLYDAEGRADYERIRKTISFQQGLERLRLGLEEHTIALLCSEADPLDCHRGLMIAPALAEQGICAGHIHPDGRIESTAELEERLLAEAGQRDMVEGLFAAQWSEEERQRTLADAYRWMAKRKAFRLPPGQSPWDEDETMNEE